MAVSLSQANGAVSRVELDHPQAWQLFSRRLGSADHAANLRAAVAPAPSAVAASGQGRADSLWESYIVVGGMTCASCSLLVEQALLAVPGVRKASVNAASGMARVLWSSARTRPSQWFAAICAAGYAAAPVDDAAVQSQRTQASRQLLWQWLVAGFCMMQVMMYAVPAYLADPADIGEDARHLMRWASWVLTLPVMLFSATPFFSGAWRSLRQRRVGMDVSVAFGLLIAFLVSSVATMDPQGMLGGEVWFDSVTMFVFFLLSARLFEQTLRERSLTAFENLSRSLPAFAVRRVSQGVAGAARQEWETVDLAQLRAGDVLRVRAGEVFAADGVLLEGATRVDESLLTGESQPLARSQGDLVMAGSHNLHATVMMRVQGVGEQTRHAGIVALMQQAATDKPAAAQLAERLAGPLLWLVLLCSAAAAGWWWSSDPSRAIGVAVAVLIVTCPCALSLATPAALVSAAGALAQRGVLMRRLQAFSALASADCIVFDKTGTLTVDRIALKRIDARPGMSQREALSLAAALAAHSLHPLSRAVVAAAAQSPASPSADAGFALHGVTEIHGQGVQGWRVAPRAEGADTSLRLGSPRFCELGEVHTSSPEPMTVHLCDERGWAASFVFEETVREGVNDAMQCLRTLGLRPELLSGDRTAPVQSLAAKLQIEVAQGDMTPDEKLAHVQQLQAKGHRVVMVGDGLNDGPVLARADASVALGDAAPLARAQADVLIPGGQPDRLPLLVAHARRTQAVIRQNLVWALTWNSVAIPLAMAGWMPAGLAGLGMAASSLLVVLNAARLIRIP